MFSAGGCHHCTANSAAEAQLFRSSSVSAEAFISVCVYICSACGKCMCCKRLLLLWQLALWIIWRCGLMSAWALAAVICVHSRKCRHCMSIFKRIWHRCKFCLTETFLFALFFLFFIFKRLFFSLSFPPTSRSVQQMLFGPHVTRYYKTIQTACRNLIFWYMCCIQNFTIHTNNKPIKQK